MDRAIALSAGWARPWASSSVATSDSRANRSVPPSLGPSVVVGPAETGVPPPAAAAVVEGPLAGVELPLQAWTTSAVPTATTTTPARM